VVRHPNVGEEKYFIVDNTNWYVGELAVYKMNGEKFDKVKKDGFSKD
jgi:hypothetical protein